MPSSYAYACPILFPLQKKATQRWPFSIGEPISTLRPSAGQHLTAIGGRHSLTETMFHLTMPFLGLIRTKHVFSPFRTRLRTAAFCKYILYTDNTEKVKPFSRLFFRRAEKCRIFARQIRTPGLEKGPGGPAGYERREGTKPLPYSVSK